MYFLINACSEKKISKKYEYLKSKKETGKILLTFPDFSYIISSIESAVKKYTF